MEIEYTDYSSQKLARLYPFGKNRSPITVSKHKPCGSKEYNPADINWPAIGVTTPETATEFAVAIIRAVQIAAEFDRGG